MSGALPWDQLTENAANAVADVVELLAGGMTGEITLRCSDGGVSEVRITGGKGTVAILKDGMRHRRLLTQVPTPK